jgi:hypothetical protein
VDDFKFMGSWPAWIRWLVVLPIAFAVASVFWILADLFSNAAFFELAVLPVSFLFVWCGVATAPRFKLTVAFILALVSLRLASHVFFDLTGSHWFFPFGRGVWLFTFWIMPESWPYLLGLVIALGLAVWRGVRRRRNPFEWADWIGASAILLVLGIWLSQAAPEFLEYYKYMSRR